MCVGLPLEVFPCCMPRGTRLLLAARRKGSIASSPLPP